jgi:putative membrane protein
MAQQSTPEDDRVREHLANERTLLSWIRLGLSSAGFGFVVARFGLFLRELAARGSAAPPGHGAEIIGVGLVLLGVLAVVAGAMRYFRTEREISARGYTPQYGLIWLVVGVSLLAGLALAGYLVVTGG